MDLISILFFFAITFSIGLGLTLFVKESENFLERNLMRLGIGLGAFVTLGLLFNLLRIPLDWKIFFAVGILCILSYFFRNRKALQLKIPGFKLKQKDLMTLVMLILFFLTFFMYQKGAFRYPYLEDDDSWAHAIGVKYVSIEKTVFAYKLGLRYIDPYPPAYDMVFGILHQINNSVYWTMKFFNALIVSFSIIFFYFFAALFTNSSKKALFSAFALFSMPSFLSHFIWSIAITMPLFFVSFYAVEKIKDDRKWWAVSAVVIAATITTSPSHSAYFGLFFIIYFVTRTLVERRFLVYEFLAGFSGLVLSLIVWWLPMIAAHGLRGTLTGLGSNPNTSILDVAGTADRIYTARDFFIAQKTNMINNPIGIGLILSLLLVAAIVLLALSYYKELKKNRLAIFAVFSIVIAFTLFLLSYTYVKHVTKVATPQLKKGTVPFFEFLSDQIYVVIILSVMIFMLTSLIVMSYKKQGFRDGHTAVSLAWLIFSFFAVNAAPYYYKLSPFRAWMLLAIPASLFIGEAISSINDLVKSFVINIAKNKTAAIIASSVVLGLIAYGVITTSFIQKYTVNTAIWPPGAFWTSNEEIQGYIWLKNNIPSDAKVFTFSNNALIIGLDKFICHWCSEVQDYKRNGFNLTAEENYNWLKKESYDYIIIDGQTVRKFGVNATNNKIQGFINSSMFRPVFNNNGVILFGVA